MEEKNVLNVFKLEKFYYVPKYDLVIEANDLDIEDMEHQNQEKKRTNMNMLRN